MSANNVNIEKNATIGLDRESMQTLIELLQTLEMFKGYINDQMVSDLSKIIAQIFKLANAASSTDMVEIMERALQDPELDKALIAPPRADFISLVKAMQDPDVQRGLGIMIALLRAMGKASADRSKWR